MLCLYLLTTIVYILLFNDTWAVNPTYVNIKTAKYSYQCMLKYNRKNYFVCPQMWLCFFMFWPIQHVQLLNSFNSLTAIDTVSWLGGREVTLQTVLQDARVRFPALATTFMFSLCFVVVVILLFCLLNIIYMKFCNSFCNVNSFGILHILQNVWQII